VKIGKPKGQDDSEQDNATAKQVAVVRGQNSVFVLPFDPSSMAEFLPQVLDRVNGEDDAIQLLVLTSDSESAIAVARGIRDSGDRSLRTVPITGIPRAMRLLAANQPQVVAGASTAILGLIRSSALKLESIKGVVIAWADDITASEEIIALESIMAEVPREAARTIVASRTTTAVETLIERYARRAGRAGVEPAGESGGASMSFVTVSNSSRLSSLRRLLDHVNPELASIYVRSDAAKAEVEDLLGALGYGGADGSISVAHRAPPKPEATVVLYELPASRTELRAATGTDQPAIFAFVRPSQLPALRLLAGRGTVTALTLPGPTESAAKSEDALRGKLRHLLSEGVPARELLTLEPLLSEFDGIEIAAAALKLLLSSGEPAPQPPAAEARTQIDAPVSMVRIFVSIGKTDGVSPGDLVGGITAECGISSTKIGKIEIRERHALVEIASDVVEAVVGSVTGIMIRGRRIIAKIDSGIPREAERGGRDGGRDSRPRSRDAGARERGNSTPSREAPPRDREGRPGGRDARPRDRDSRPRDAGPPRRDRDVKQSGSYAGKRSPGGPRSSAPPSRQRSDRESGGRGRPRG